MSDQIKESVFLKDEPFFQSLVEHSNCGIWILDSQDRTVEVNQALCLIFARKKEEMMGLKPTDFSDETNFERLRQFSSKAPFQTSRRFEVNLFSGTNQQTTALFQVVRIQNNNQDYICAIVTDIGNCEATRVKLQETEEKYRHLLDNIQDGMLIVQEETIRFANSAMSKITGYENAELLNTKIEKLLTAKELERLRRFFSGKKDVSQWLNNYETAILQKNGNQVFLNLMGSVIHYEGKKATLITAKDITERKLLDQEKDLSLNQLRFDFEYVDYLLEVMPVGVWIVDFLPLETQSDANDSQLEWHRQAGVRTKIQRVNLSLTQMLGYESLDLIGKSIFHPLLVDDVNATIFVDQIQKRYRGERGSYEIELLHKDGRKIPVNLESIPTIIDPDTQKADQSIGILVDLTERKRWENELKQLNQKLEELSFKDSLTELANRRQFDEFFHKEWERSLREKWKLSLIFIDIDFFKPYNDGYGHQAGDECLKRVASILREEIHRSSDLVSRYGGEEFAIVLPNTNERGALMIAEKVRQKVVKEKIEHKYSKIGNHLSISLGVSTLRPSRKLSPHELLFLADQALYRSKKEGRNRSTVASNMSI